METKRRGHITVANKISACKFLIDLDFSAIDWAALSSTIPAMLALTFFGVLHVPINVPALGVSTNQDDVDVNKELVGHGISNTLSGCCGSVQSMLYPLIDPIHVKNNCRLITDEFIDVLPRLSCIHQQFTIYQVWR